MHFGHEPAGGGGSSTNAYALFPFEPAGIYFGNIRYEVRPGIDLQAFAEKHFPVGAFFTADEENEVVSPGKFPDIGYSVGDLPADGVERFELPVWLYLLDFVDDMFEPFDRFGGLGVEEQFFVEVDFAEVLAVFDDHGLPMSLSHQTVYFGVSGFP